MSGEGFKRKLSAILSADVAGYSRLMGEDDDATGRTLTGHREMMSTLIRQHQGRVVDSPGDNLLAEFESVLQGVNCAVEIQRELAERNAELPDDRKLEYRIGVNLGDVIKEGDRIYGDGVNIAALTGHHLWSEKYDRKMKDLFDLQDEITKKIVVELHVELTEGEYIRLPAKSTDNLEAWNYYIKGLELFWKFNEEANAKAREYFKAATNLDPGFVTAFAHQAATHRWDAISGWSNSPSNSLKFADELVQKALKIDEQDAFVHVMLANIYLHQKQHGKAIIEGKRAIALNPNFGFGHAFLAHTMLLSGRFDEALTLMKKAYRLDPNLPLIWSSLLSKIYVYLGHYEEAIEVCNQIQERAKKGNFVEWITILDLSFVCQELGKEEQAHEYMAEAIKMNPKLSLENIKKKDPFKNPAHLQRELDGYRKAGLPEKPPGAVT